jgi:hypothetical protein
MRPALRELRLVDRLGLHVTNYCARIISWYEKRRISRQVQRLPHYRWPIQNTVFERCSTSQISMGTLVSAGKPSAPPVGLAQS